MGMEPPIKLEKPGAGLPGRRLMVMKPLFRLAARSLPTEMFRRLYAEEREKILRLCAELSEEVGRRPVLVPQLNGLEDSSRYWSPFMCLQHLSIVDAGLSGFILALEAGEKIDHVVRTEDVKPEEDAGPIEVRKFEVGTRRTSARLAPLTQFNQVRSYAHPWFGPLSARQWFALRAVHLRIHRKQLEMILSEPSLGNVHAGG